MKINKLLTGILFAAVSSSAMANGVTAELMRALRMSHSAHNYANNTAVNNTSNITNYPDSKKPDLCPEHYPLGAPRVVSENRDKIERRSFYLCRTGYAVQFDPATKTPLWSAEQLDARLLSGARESRTDDFQPDPQVPFPAQASLNDYKGSGFDRGHMTPAADQTGRAGNAMSESFYLTNMVPQVGMNQNRGIWSDLEGQVRDWTQGHGQLLVITGPIFGQDSAIMGRSKVLVPTYLYKVVLDPKTLESIAFIIPNRQIVTRKTRQLDRGNAQYPQTLPDNAVQCQNTCTAQNFAVPISEVEKATGLKFFSNLRENDHVIATQSIRGSWQFKR